MAYRPVVSTSARARSALEIDNLQEVLREHETRLVELTGSYEQLQNRYLELTELRHVLRETAAFFEEVK